MSCASGKCGCSSGIGCAKLTVFDWLSDIPDNASVSHKYIEVSFNEGGIKEFYLNPSKKKFHIGEWVSVESKQVGIEVGKVSLVGHLVLLHMKKLKIDPNDKSASFKSILHKTTEEEMQRHLAAKSKENDTLIKARAIIKSLNLSMKLSLVEIQSDEKRISFYYIAEERVDFRELIKRYTSEFKAQIDMRQISARKEASLIGGIGSCGRDLCCSSWLAHPKSVNIAAARYQELSIKSEKLNGQCGRLKCCLNYELDAHIEALNTFPKHIKKISLKEGSLKLIKKNIFKRTMVYETSEDGGFIMLDIEDVKKLVEKKASLSDVKKMDKTPVKETKPAAAADRLVIS